MPVLSKLYAEVQGEKFNTRTVDSGNVVWVAWPVNGKPLMLVKYRGGTIYAYLGVSRQRAVAAAFAKSTGSYINRVIKPNFEVVQINARNT